MIMKNLSFSDKEFYCQQNFEKHGPYWHIATPGTTTEILFTNNEEYAFGMTLMAESLYVCGVKSYAFSLMSNHLHNIAEAVKKQQCIDFLEHYGTRLRRFAKSKGRSLDLDGFVCEPLPIDNLSSLRNNMVYVDRNPYVINSTQTPYSYPWGSGFLYFGYSPALIPSVPYSSLNLREKRALTHSRDVVLSDQYTVRNGFVAPESFVDWRTGRGFFRDAHQYFNLLTKNRESYSEFAALLGDRVVLTDEEMYGAALSIASKEYQISRLAELTDYQKKNIAAKLHFEYRAGNAQIWRILKIDKAILQELYPEAR